MKWTRDPTGRFARRPYFEDGEIDALCWRAVEDYLLARTGQGFEPPIGTNVLTVLTESHVEDLDLYADLQAREGSDVEGMTTFETNRRPRVQIDKSLSLDPTRENRLRSTLAHELFHVLFHRDLWEGRWKQSDLWTTAQHSAVCRRETIVHAGSTDWLEWQAGYGAGAILMPRLFVVSTASRAVGRLGGTPCREGTAEAAVVAAEVAKAFAVSIEAASVRLAQLGIISGSPVQQRLL